MDFRRQIVKLVSMSNGHYFSRAITVVIHCINVISVNTCVFFNITNIKRVKYFQWISINYLTTFLSQVMVIIASIIWPSLSCVFDKLPVYIHTYSTELASCKIFGFTDMCWGQRAWDDCVWSLLYKSSRFIILFLMFAAMCVCYPLVVC